jgi:hypothetical protein
MFTYVSNAVDHSADDAATDDICVDFEDGIVVQLTFPKNDQHLIYIPFMTMIGNHE